MSNTSIRRLMRRMVSLDNKIREVNAELNKRIEKKLGHGWGVVQQTDGICLIDEGANNYYLSPDSVADILKLDRQEAIEIIRRDGLI